MRLVGCVRDRVVVGGDTLDIFVVAFNDVDLRLIGLQDELVGFGAARDAGNEDSAKSLVALSHLRPSVLETSNVEDIIAEGDLVNGIGLV